MGSYNVACGISSLSIGYEDEAGFLILRAKKEYNRSQLKPNGKTIQIYNTDNYMPVFPPIFGTYDTYGSLESIIPSVTTQLLESIYLKPIETVMACFGNQDRAIYSSMGPISKHYMIEGNQMGDYRVDDETKMLSLGFTKVDNSLLPEKPAYFFNSFIMAQISENEWAVFNDDGVQVSSNFNEFSLDGNLTMFGQITGSYPGFHPEHWKIIEDLASTNGMFFLPSALTKITASLAEEEFVAKDSQKKADAWEEFMKSFTHGYIPNFPAGFADMSFMLDLHEPDAAGRRRFASSWGLPMNDYLSRNTALAPAEFDLLHVYKDSTEFSAVWDILNATSALNRSLAPSMYATERFNPDVFADLAELTKEILAKREENW